MAPLGTPDRVVDAELDASGITIGDVGLQVGGSDVSGSNPVPTNDVGLPDTLGQKARAAAAGVTLSTEDQATLDAIAASASILDDWDESDRGKMVLPDKKRIAVEKTRPANTDAYIAKDSISESLTVPTVWTFTDAARKNAGTGYIVGFRLFTDQTTCTARFRLHLFHTTPTAINDNSPYTLLYANFTNRIGQLDSPPLGTEGAGSTAAGALNIVDRLPFVCAAADDNLYGILETLDAFTPASGQKFHVELQIERD